MSGLLDVSRTQLLVIDVQERLLPAVAAPDMVLANCERLARAAGLLGAPVTISEQYPKGIGPTVGALRAALPNGAVTLEKTAFSCMAEETIDARMRALAQAGRDQVLVCGIEAHVCVLQSALDIVTAGLACYVAVDATASRAPHSHEIATRRMERAGVTLVTTEMALFEWLRKAGTPDFKALLPLIK